MSVSVERVAFLGFALPDDRFSEVAAADPALPIQTQRFGWAVIDALQLAGIDVSVISTDPVADYPSHAKLRFHSRRFAAHGVQGVVVPFINATGIKHVSRFVSVTRALFAGFRTSPVDAVVVHGVNSALLWAAAAFGRRTGVPFIVLLTDPPSVRTPYDNPGTWQLKQVDRWVIMMALRRAAGVVALAPRLAEDFAPGVPWLHMEGISSTVSDATISGTPGDGSSETSAVSSPERVVYAGGLREAFGVLDLVDAVTRSDGQWRLEIYGRGPESTAVEAAAATSSRVHFGGLVDGDDLQRIYSSADLLINPRHIDGDLPQYSFPSKLLEYMATGTPVMTTRLPTLPEDYEPHLCLTEQGGPELARSIDSFFARPSAERIDLGSSAQAFILATRGHLAQGLRLRNFITEVCATKHRSPAPRNSASR